MSTNLATRNARKPVSSDPANPPTLDPADWLGHFGLESFRPGQDRVIQAILNGRDTLCIMPTGGGKSLCYQLPTIAREGTTLVISPLIALMKDQVDSLTKIGIPATFINSSLDSVEQHARIDAMVQGRYKLVYIAPERLRSVSFLRAVSKTKIQFLAIDEAHCISQWGHDFRPDYARLGRFRERLGNPQTVALTATATEYVQEDIAKILKMETPARFITGFARDNLSLHVATPNSNSEKDNLLIDFLKSHDGCGIVYASTRKNCEHLVELLEGEIGRTIAFYHGGLGASERRSVQEQFMSGEIPIIVATNAFGMGIDKSDLRFVVHYNLPGSVEAYYQEAGRAGRDGLPSKCLLLYSFQDRFIQEFFIENAYPAKETIKEVYEHLRTIKREPIEVTLNEIKEDLGLQIGSTGIATCENLLEKAGAIERLDSQQNMAAIRIDSEMRTLIDYLPRDARTQRHVLRGLEALVGPMRGERVMFRPQKFAERMEMKWEAVNRAIKQLVKLEQLDYVPPFRGRAIHMLCPEKPFSKLKIDFGELDRRKQSEVDKLNKVIQLATTRRCRQLEILEYFGDPDRQFCGNCDNCAAVSATKTKKRVTGFVDSDACLYAVQVALSGTARTKGRFGKNLIAKMLQGSEAKQVLKMGLNRLSTFGLLNALRQGEVVSLLDWLIAAGYITCVETTKFRPLCTVSPTGRQLMAGQLNIDVSNFMADDLVRVISRNLRGKQPHIASTRKTESIELATDTEISKDDRSNTDVSNADVSNADVSEDNDLEDNDLDSAESAGPISNHSPEEPSDATEINEIAIEEFDQELEDELQDELQDELEYERATGQTKTPAELDFDFDAAPAAAKRQAGKNEKNAQQTEVLMTSEFVLPNSGSGVKSASKKSTQRVDLPSPSAVKPSFFWTWRLLADGYSVEHLMQVREIDRGTILEHAIQAAEDSLHLESEWLLDRSQIESLQQLVEDSPQTRLSKLISQLPETITTQELMFFLKCQSPS